LFIFFFARSEALPALPGNAYPGGSATSYSAQVAKIVHRRQSHQACIPRQSLGTSAGEFTLSLTAMPIGAAGLQKPSVKILSG